MAPAESLWPGPPLQKLVGKGQRWIDLQRLAGLDYGLGDELAAKEETPGQEIGLRGIRIETVLCREGVTGIVVSLEVA